MKPSDKKNNGGSCFVWSETVQGQIFFGGGRKNISCDESSRGSTFGPVTSNTVGDFFSLPPGLVALV